MVNIKNSLNPLISMCNLKFQAKKNTNNARTLHWNLFISAVLRFRGALGQMRYFEVLFPLKVSWWAKKGLHFWKRPDFSETDAKSEPRIYLSDQYGNNPVLSEYRPMVETAQIILHLTVLRLIVAVQWNRDAPTDFGGFPSMYRQHLKETIRSKKQTKYR